MSSSTYQLLVLRPGPNGQGQIGASHIYEACISHPAFKIRRRGWLHSNCTDTSRGFLGPLTDGAVISKLAMASIKAQVSICTFKPASRVESASINVRHVYILAGPREQTHMLAA